MVDMLDLKGKTALVTGAGQGIGRHVALRFAQHGAGAVVVNDLFAERAEKVATEVRAWGVKALPIAADVGDRDAVRRMAQAVLESLGPVQVLVNNAGVLPEARLDSLRRFEETDLEDWDPWIRLNLYGVMLVTRAFLPGMLEKGWGRITVISDAGRVGEPYMAPYAAAKAGAAGFMRSLATEVGRRGVTANCVSLAMVKTESLLATFPSELIEKATHRYALGRPGEPEEVANVILFLASEAASWITGQVYPVNGGYSYAL